MFVNTVTVHGIIHNPNVLIYLVPGTGKFILPMSFIHLSDKYK